MERPFGCHEFGAAGQSGDLEGDLVGFGAGVAEERPRGRPEQADQRLRERDAALEMLRKESVEVALAAASQLMGENLDQAKDRELVERYLAELGDSSGAQA